MAENKEPKIRATGFEAEGIFLRDILNPKIVEKLEEKYDEVEGIVMALGLVETKEEEGEEKKTITPLVLSHGDPKDAEKGITQIKFDGSEKEAEEIIRILASG